MSGSLQDILDDAPGEVDELDSIGGTPSQLPTKEFYHNNRDSLRQLRVRELRSEYVRLGGEESTVRSLDKAKVLKAMYALVMTANEADSHALIASTESEMQRGVAKRIADAACTCTDQFPPMMADFVLGLI